MNEVGNILVIENRDLPDRNNDQYTLIEQRDGVNVYRPN